MKRLGALFLVLLFAVCLTIKPVTTGADLGDFSGSSDYGGSDWSSSSSDWGSSGSSGWSAGYGNTYYSGSSGDLDGGSAVLAFLLVLVIIIIVMKRKGASVGGAGTPAGARRTDASLLKPMSAYDALDPEFSEQRLTEKLSNIYVQMQNCCTARDITPLRPYFTDALYQQFNRQITGLKQRGETNYVERIAVLGVTLKGFCQKNGEDHIIAEINTRITDYTLRDSDGKLVSGDRNAEKFMVYEYDLSRPTGTLTAKEGATTEHHCPNCGAPLSINESAKCPYCDMVITIKEHDWTINSIKGISQRTAR